MRPLPAGGFEHEVLFYRDDEGFLAGLLPFIREGLERDEAVIVAEPRPRMELLRDALGDDAVAVSFLDMAEIGANPARIIGVWAAALEKHTSAGQQLRGRRRAGLPRTTGPRVRRVPAARAAAQPRLRRRSRLAAAVPVRRGQAAPRRRPGRPAHPPDPVDGHRPAAQRELRPARARRGVRRAACPSPPTPSCAASTGPATCRPPAARSRSTPAGSGSPTSRSRCSSWPPRSWPPTASATAAAPGRWPCGSSRTRW